MVDFLVAATLSNLLVSTVLAIFARLVQQRFSSPGLANLLWAVVLIKTVTPPLVAIPALAVPSFAGSSMPTVIVPDVVDSPLRLDRIKMEPSVQTSGGSISEVAPRTGDEASRTTVAGAQWVNLDLIVWGLIAWGLVSSLLLLVSTARLIRFHRLLLATASVDRSLSRGLASSVARQFGIKKQPDIVVTSANIAPFVWWRAGAASL